MNFKVYYSKSKGKAKAEIDGKLIIIDKIIVNCKTETVIDLNSDPKMYMKGVLKDYKLTDNILQIF